MSLLLVLLLVPSFAWVSTFTNRIPINVTTTENVTDYQLLINVTYDSGMDSDFDDLYFTDVNDGELHYYIESKIDDEYASIWLRGNWTTLNGIQAYIYFNNPNPYPTFSDGNETFQLFDDFLGTSLDTDIWTETSGTVTVGGGMLQAVRSGTDIQLDSDLTFTGNNWGIKWRGYHENTQYNSLGFSIPGSDYYTIFQNAVVSGESRIYVRNDTVQAYSSSANSDLGSFATYELRRLFPVTLYKNDVLFETESTTKPQATAIPVVIRSRTGNQNVSVDWIFVFKINSNPPTLTLETKETTSLVILKSSLYAHLNELITFSLSGQIGNNLTKTWWYFNDTGFPLSYVVGNSTTHNFTTSGAHYINVTAYDDTSSTNKTGELTFTVYDDLTIIDLELDRYLPYLVESHYESINYSSTGGSPEVNNTFILTLPNGTITTFENYAESVLDYEINIEGIHGVFLEVCDEYATPTVCLNDTDTFKAWNITGGVNLVTAFNQTDNLVAQVFENDVITFSSDSNLNWTLNGTSQVGNQVDLTFGSSDWFYNDSDYYHYNISVTNTWGIHSASEWFSVIVAKYTFGHNLACSYNSFCMINAAIMCEISCTKLINDNLYNGYLSVKTEYGHNKEWGIYTDDADLNVSLCLNATPLINSITYFASSVDETGDYRTYAYDDVDFLLSDTCTNANSKNYTYWGIPGDFATDVTITVTRAGTALDDVLINIQKFVEDSETWQTMTNQITDINGQIQLPLQLCSNYYKIVIEETGEVIYTEKTCFKSSGYSINLIAEETDYFVIKNGVSGLCSFSNITNYFSCLVSNSGGLTATSELFVNYAWGGNNVCTTSESSVSATLLCNMAGYEGDFKYLLEVTSQDSTFIMDSGSFSIGGEDRFGNTGNLMALLFLLMIVLTGAFFGLNPVALILISIFSFIVFRVLGWITITGGAIGWLIALGILAVWKVVT